MKLVVDGISRPCDRGCHIVGPDAGEMIQLIGIAVKMKATKADFDATMAVHPTAAEELVTMREKAVSHVRGRRRRGRIGLFFSDLACISPAIPVKECVRWPSVGPARIGARSRSSRFRNTRTWRLCRRSKASCRPILRWCSPEKRATSGPSLAVSRRARVSCCKAGIAPRASPTRAPTTSAPTTSATSCACSCRWRWCSPMPPRCRW